jgi:hypothetical protein
MSQIFLSYAWGPADAAGNHPLQAKAHAIVAALREAGYSVWLDTESMAASASGGSGTSDAMVQGITAADHVVVCFSEAYAKSTNCKKELTFAAHLEKKMFYVNVGEPLYTAKSFVASAPEQSWLLFFMQDALWADCRTDDAAKSAKGIPTLLAALSGVKATGTASAPSSTVASASLSRLPLRTPSMTSAASADDGLPCATSPRTSASERVAPTTEASFPAATPSAGDLVDLSLDRVRAEALLAPYIAAGTPGIFLVRGSREGPGNFALSFTYRAAGQATVTLRHALAQSVPGHPRHLRISDGQGGSAVSHREFANLAELVGSFPYLEYALSSRTGVLVPRASFVSMFAHHCDYGDANEPAAPAPVSDATGSYQYFPLPK